MKTLQQAKRIVQGCKERLRTETDPEARYAIAVIGKEFNELAMQLQGIQPTKVCKKCKKELPEDHFKTVKGKHIHKKKDGTIVVYECVGKRRICKSCTWPADKVRKLNLRRMKSDFIVSGLRIY